MTSFQEVLEYWFEKPNDYHKWFFSGQNLDEFINKKFKLLLETVKDKNSKPKDIRDVLSKIILLDQFSRHIYRGTPKAFECDNITLELTLKIIETNDIDKLNAHEKIFALMPLQNSESIQDKKILLDYVNSIIDNTKKEDLFIYQNIIDNTINRKSILTKYGRYPTRNMILGRESTKDELNYILTLPLIVP